VADRKLVERLRGGSAVWNAWWRDNKVSLGYLDGADLIGANLSGANLKGAYLGKCCLLNANLSVANLGAADLSAADLSGANMSAADLSVANLKGADLSGADLSGANLSGSNLSMASLNGANMRGAHLSGANLSGADLSAANLNNANLTGAELGGANLSGANLSGAVLSNTNLSRARLINTDMHGINLSGAKVFNASFGETVLVHVDLNAVVGLETCRHTGPSVIDFRTLKNSWPLPLAFLRGVGLPENLIDYLPTLMGQHIHYHSCFISYSSEDDDFAERIHDDLQNSGVRCWFAPHDLSEGGKTVDGSDAAVQLRDKLLLVLSDQALKGDWVEDEIKAACEEERRRGQTVLFPIRLDDTVLETKEPWASKLRMDRTISDFRQWKDHGSYHESLASVLRHLSARPLSDDQARSDDQAEDVKITSVRSD
jgi:uncharacterized protein YjbI with pentapeptide repeats